MKRSLAGFMWRFGVIEDSLSNVNGSLVNMSVIVLLGDKMLVSTNGDGLVTNTILVSITADRPMGVI
jgi:hypothetical protein